MTVAALRTSSAVLSVFVALTLTFIFLTIGRWGGGNADMVKIGGWLGLVTAALAWYASAAGVINDTHKRVVLPVGPRG
jgi:succinate-acetate transporter protein